MIRSNLTASGDSVRARADWERTRPRVLIVDDDELILASLQNLFHLETDYELAVETNPSKAVQRLSTKRFDVVISDFLMPGMDGIQLLETAGKLQPQATRILLTGYGDGRRIRKAVRELGLHHVEKPWNNAAILNLIAGSLRERSSTSSTADTRHESTQGFSSTLV